MSSELPTKATSGAVVYPEYGIPNIDYFEPGDRSGKWKGYGNAEVLDIVKILNEVGIVSCVVGIGALRYYGAGRIMDNWEICVPSEDFSRAVNLLKSPPYDHIYGLCPPVIPTVCSMLHAFPLFKLRGVDVHFQLVPADDCHIDCISSNIELSQNGLPYPKLPVLAQSFLATHTLVDLTDLVDGMNLDQAWGEQNLDLSGSNDVPWACIKNERIENSLPDLEPDSIMATIPDGPYSCAETWERIVNGREHRIGIKGHKEILELYSTRFRFKGDGDPRQRDRPFV